MPGEKILAIESETNNWIIISENENYEINVGLDILINNR